MIFIHYARGRSAICLYLTNRGPSIPDNLKYLTQNFLIMLDDRYNLNKKLFLTATLLHFS